MNPLLIPRPRPDPAPAPAGLRGFLHRLDLQAQRLTWKIFGSELIVVVVAIGAATWLRSSLNEVLGNRAAFVTYFIVIILCSRWLSLGASLMATGLGAWAANHYFGYVSPTGEVDVLASLIHTSAFLVVAIFIALLGHAERRSRQREQRELAESRTTAHKLRDAERRFRLLAETMPQMVWMADADGKLGWTNPLWVDYVGASIEEARDQGWDAFHPDDRSQMFASWSTALREHTPYHLEVRIRQARDQVFRWFLVRAVPQIGDHGQVDFWIGTCTDIDDLKVAQEALRASAERERNRQQQLQLALEGAQIGTWELQPDRRTPVLDVRCRDLFGLEADSVISRRGMLRLIHADDRREVLWTMGRALDPAGDGMFEVGFRTIGADDGIVRHLKANGRAVFRDGEFFRFSGTVIDVSALHRVAERDRIQAEAGALLVEGFDVTQALTRMANLCVTHMVDWCSIDLVDDRGAVARIAVAHKDPRRIPLAHDLHRRYPPKPESPVRQVISQGRAFYLERITDEMIVRGAVDADHLGLIRELGLRSLIVVPLKARDQAFGSLTLVTAESRRSLGVDDLAFAEELGRRIGLAIDNARLFAAEKAARTFAVDRAETLSRLNAELEQFAYVCSHDLQEPLRMITQYLDLLRRRLGDGLDANSIRHMNYVSEGANRMRSLILNLLAYARVGNADEPSLEIVSLDRVFTEAEENLKASLTEVQAVIRREPLQQVLGSKIQLVQVMQNLLANAVKFRRQEPLVIEITGAVTGSQYVVTIRDNGIGIPEDQRERIFKPFHRAHAHGDYPGSGIGLAICKKIVTRFGGSIWVGESPRGGSTFGVALPLAASDRLRARGVPPAAPTGAAVTSAPHVGGGPELTGG